MVMEESYLQIIKKFMKTFASQKSWIKNRDTAICWGYNARLSDLNAKFASTKLNYLNNWNKNIEQLQNIIR